MNYHNEVRIALWDARMRIVDLLPAPTGALSAMTTAERNYWKAVVAVHDAADRISDAMELLAAERRINAVKDAVEGRR